MLDLNFIKNNTEIIKQACKNKNIEIDLEKFLSLEQRRKEYLEQLEKLRQKRNTISNKMKEKQDPALIEQARQIKEEIHNLEKKYKSIDEKFNTLWKKIPNIPSEDTPIGKDEKDNKIIKKVGKKRIFDFTPKPHWELGEILGTINKEKAAEIAGSRFAYLLGDLVLLEFALIQHTIDTLTNPNKLDQIIEKNNLKVSNTPFIPVIPPVFIRPEIFDKMDRLEPREDRYYIEKDDLFLIGSSEHTLGPLHMNETFDYTELPRRYLGFSTCFRREAGTYGKDTKGILRMHQFDKLEMESFTTKELSKEEQNFFVAIQEYLMQSLEIPYQVVAICTGDMGKPDARQIDIESWMPGQNKYRETQTSDLMTDYQARRLNIKVKKEDGTTEFVHMNDATAYAIGRTIIAIMENYQQQNGSIIIPSILQKYTGKEKIEAIK